VADGLGVSRMPTIMDGALADFDITVVRARGIVHKPRLAERATAAPARRRDGDRPGMAAAVTAAMDPDRGQDVSPRSTVAAAGS
jgi:hypothetical protein